MIKKAKKHFIIGAILLLLFALLTVTVKTVDVVAVGPEGSKIGLSGINTFFRDLIGVNMTVYEITDILGYLAIADAGCFAILGACQLVKGKSIKAVDSNLIVLGCFFAAVVCSYVFFEVVIINYRPIIMDGELEASYPSSHTMLSIASLGAAIHQLSFRIGKKSLRASAIALCSVMMAVIVIGRLLSGVNWFTDIVAGALLALSLLMLYIGFCKLFEAKK